MVRMKNLKFLHNFNKLAVFALVFLGFVTGCASTTGGARGPAQSALALCAGTNVSNAPAANSDGTIRNFRAVTAVKGRSLATAPAQGCLSSGFGKRKGGAGKYHRGIDIFTRTPVPILAAGDGKVSFVGRQSGYGRLIEIDHGRGVRTRYAHLSSVKKALKVGDRVKAGIIIGKTGKTGNASAVHLHYEILLKGKQRNPLNF